MWSACACVQARACSKPRILIAHGVKYTHPFKIRKRVLDHHAHASRSSHMSFGDKSWSPRLHLGYWGDVVATTGPRVCFQVCVVRIFAATDVNIPGMV